MDEKGREPDEPWLQVDDLWPVSLGELSGRKLRLLDDHEFSLLQRRIADRAKVHTGSRAFAQRLARELKRRRRGDSPRLVIPPKMLMRSRAKSAILDALVPDRADRWVPPWKRSEQPVFEVRSFSFIDDPQKTMDLLAALARAECDAVNVTMDFDDPIVLDIGPYLVWGLMRTDMVPFTRGGKISLHTQAVIEAVGLRDAMRIKKFRRKANVTDIMPFTMRKRRLPGTSARDNLATAVTTKEKVADDFVATVDTWLEQLSPPLELSPEGRSRLCGILTELLDNAERHSHLGSDGDWAIAGFMTPREVRLPDGKAERIHVCHVAIVSIGCSFAESLATAEEGLKADLTAYQDRHRRCGVTTDTLAAVYAVQDGVSRIPQGSDESKGGVGLMDMVEFTHALGGMASAVLPPRIGIISGASCVVFGDPYWIDRDERDARRRLQWFNSAHSIDTAPDRSHVFDLKQAFPGTIISLRFALPAGAVGE